jgi:hypothetical protein
MWAKLSMKRGGNSAQRTFLASPPSLHPDILDLGGLVEELMPCFTLWIESISVDPEASRKEGIRISPTLYRSPLLISQQDI